MLESNVHYPMDCNHHLVQVALREEHAVVQRPPLRIHYYDEVGDLVRQIPAGTKSRVTVTSYDALRRTTQTVMGYYKDDVDERWEVNGYVETSDGDPFTVNPVLIQKFDVDDGSGARRTEQIAAEYIPTGKPPDDHTFQQSSYQRWSTEHYDTHPLLPLLGIQKLLQLRPGP